MADEEPLRKVGRGGAGNFYTRAEIREASVQHEDIEAQKLTEPDSSLYRAMTASNANAPTLVGRGGAGNYVAPAEAERGGAGGGGDSELHGDDGGHDSGVMGKAKEVVAAAKDVVLEKLHVRSPESGSTSASGPGSTTGYGGRGGAGNWRGVSKEDVEARAAQERRREEEVRDKAVGDVEAGLARPGVVYRRGGGRAWEGDEERDV